MSKVNVTHWKNEQREILRAAFGPAFTRYTEMVGKVDTPDDYRKYLEFIAKQVGLEEPVLKTGPHDGLTTVQINIGQFHQNARALGAVPFGASAGGSMDTRGLGGGAFDPSAPRPSDEIVDVGELEPMRDLAHAVMTPPEQVTYSDPYPVVPAHVMVPGLATQLAMDVLDVPTDDYMAQLDSMLQT